MTLRSFRYSTALLVVTLLGILGTGVAHAQAAAEYGMMTGNSAGLAASGRPLIPFPNVGNLGNTPGAAGAVSGPAGVAAGTAEAAAKTNLQYFQANAGANAAHIAINTVPDKASAWIDGRFVGAAPLNLKLAPGHHQILIRSPNMQESTQGFDLSAKQSQAINVALKSAYQSQVTIQWPSKK